MASFPLGGGGSIGARAPAEERGLASAPAGRLGKLWSFVRMIYTNDFTRYFNKIIKKHRLCHV